MHTHTNPHKHRQSLHTYGKGAKAASVGGSVTSTRDDKRQFSSRHHMTLCTRRGWMEIHGWSEGERDCVLGLKLAMIPPQGFARTCRVRANTHACTQAHTCIHTHTHICIHTHTLRHDFTLLSPSLHLLTCTFHN